MIYLHYIHRKHTFSIHPRTPQPLPPVYQTDLTGFVYKTPVNSQEPYYRKRGDTITPPLIDARILFANLLIYLKEFDPPTFQIGAHLSHTLRRHVSERDVKTLLDSTVHNKNYMRRYTKHMVETLTAQGKTPRYIADLLQIDIHTVYYHKRNPATRPFECKAIEAIVGHYLKDLEYTNRNGRGEYEEKFGTPVYDKFLVTDYKLTEQISDPDDF